MVNEKFMDLLKGYKLNPAVIDLYKTLITQTYEIETGNGKAEVLLFKKQLVDLNNKINTARELLLSGDLDGSDYKKIKSDCERQVSIIEGKLVDSVQTTEGIGPLLNKALRNMSKLPELYQIADYEHKRHLLSSMFPEKLSFDGEQHRTLRLNEVIRVFDSVKAVFEQKKDRRSGVKLDLRSKVTFRPQFLNFFLEDLKRLASININC